ncbi:hypothetical protein [Metabacillus malikii]|uniref:DNA-binding transcriptional regulator YafY n=1 Tax=Metabacillus malikii TaxID=1504265 RepID=A0ABT9ZB71_9BACI|nr:hypothetical protein [Metabacillus malikii]MDQ0229499.1 putative DNA-binding transcriptional regulator YafY [Metabacillus malikii]
MRQFVQFSLDEQKPIEIIYLSKKGVISQRKILVKQFVNKQVIAYCFKRHQIRSFTLEQILSARRLFSKIA